MGWGGLNLTQVMLLQSIFTFGVFLFEVPTGVVADKYGRRTSLIWGSIFGILGFTLYVLTSNLLLFVASELVLALALTFRSGANEALLYESLPDKSKAQSAFARLEIISMLGIMLGPFLGSWLLNWGTPRQVFSSQIIAMLISFIFASHLSADSRSEETEQKRFWTILINGTKIVFSNRRLLILALDMSLVAGLSKTMVFLFQAELLTQQVDLAWIGRIQGLGVGVEIVVIYLSSWLAEKISNGKNIVILGSGLIPAFGFWLLGKSIFFTALAVALTIGFGLSRKPLFKAIFNEHLTNSERATAISSMSMLSNLFLAVINPMVGYFADHNLLLTSRVLGITLVAGVFISWLTRKRFQ